ncbi:MAG: NADH:ubiquinone reductase (Na(+)-transporting) subunit A [Burkholderiaceae bacterium]
MKLSIRAGLQIDLPGPPIQRIQPANAILTVGLLGTDLPGVRAELLVAEGERVAAGDALFRDRKRPQIRFTAPVAGTVRAIDLGEKRRLSSLAIAVDGSERRHFEIPTHPDREQTQALLLESGLWPSFTARPFGRIPDPGSTPDAIFVTALDTEPLAADARVVLADAMDDFARGVACLKPLTDGPVFVCQAPGSAFVAQDDRIRCVEVDGAHPAGLAGTHVNRLFPLHGRRSVWQVHYQDVMAIGALLRSGEITGERVVALAGAGIAQPRLVRVPGGADLEDLVRGEMTGGAMRIVSGSPLGGRPSRFLGRHHWQVSVTPRRAAPLRPGRPGWFGRHARDLKPLSVIATAALEHALATDIPVMPLLRALSVGDTETAARLGCRELLEEDMALVGYATGATQDYAALLRATLDVLEHSR